MLPTKRPRFKTEELLNLLWMCFGIAVVLAVLQETASFATEPTAQNIKVHSSATDTPLDPKYNEARQALEQAEALRANWSEASLRQAIDHYDKAVLLWTSVSDFPNASEATLKAGEVYFLFSKYSQALERYQNAESLARKTGDWLMQARALSQIGRLQNYLGNNDLAKKELIQALDLFKRHETNRTIVATNAYGEALSNLAEVSYAEGKLVISLQQLDDALEVFQNNSKGEAKARLFKGYITGTIGESDKALAEISRALELYREMNDKSGEGLALTAMGLWHSSEGIESEAIKLHTEAGEIFRAIGDRHSEAITLNGLGQVYVNLNEYSNALAFYKSALELFENMGALDAVSGTTCTIADAQYLNGDLDQALASYERCLKLSRTRRKLRDESWALSGIAKVYGAQKHHDLALKQHQKIQKFFKSIGDLRGQAMALNVQGDFFLEIGDKTKALDVYGQAFSLSQKMGDKGILISALYNLARANKALGSYEAALSLIKQSFDLIEEVRTNVGSPDFRASYFSGVRKHYDLCIAILMDLDRLRPGEGFAAEAFSVSEQGRARLLLELLSESRSKNIREGAAKELLERERRLRGLLRLQAEYQMALSLSGKDSTEIADVTAQIAQLRTEYQTVQAQLREQNPRLFAFEQFAPVSLERIQKELRDSDTILLEYTLGDEHSYLWTITSDSVQTCELPPRKDIEDAAQELYKLITARQGSDQSESYEANVGKADNLYPEQASSLSRMLLGPIAEQLGSRRIAVVTEGALQYIPFNALPVPLAKTAGPIGTSKTLLDTNEVVVLPSASTLIAIRGAQNRTSLPGKLVAIIADPVFTLTDDRVQSEALSPAIAKAAAGQDPNQFGQQTIEKLKLTRLIHASEEADAISAVAPWGTTLVAKGFDANRETAMSSEVSRSQIVHFATHGFIDGKHSEFSGIALTMIDPNGVETNGVMSLPDIYSLDLSAELVVLSACQTALGKDLKGEGLVGLTHSFMSAGANSVVASLWKVDDRATAVLMDHFYDSMLQKGMSPAAALRSAQLKMKQDPRWSAPYYWAGFVLQGEYSNHIAVDHHTWLRRGLVLLLLLILIAITPLMLQKRKRRMPPR